MARMTTSNGRVPTRDVDFFDVKGDVERLAPSARFVSEQHPALHPGRSARVELDGRAIGFIGQLHPRLQQLYELPKAAIVFELDLVPLLIRPLPQVAELSRYQPVRRDISLTVRDSVPVQAMVDAVLSLSRIDDRLSALREFRLFDVYRAPPNSSKITEASANALLNNEKSLAFRVVLQDTEQPVSDADADAALKAILEVLEQQFGARPRQ